MVVYADVLIFLNTIVNYYIVALTAKVCRVNKKWCRYVFAAFAGALFSLYIFLPKLNFILELIIKLVCSAVVVLIGFGFENVKKFARRSVIFYLISFLYAGLMLAFWSIFKPNGMVIHNSVVYFNISPLILIVLSVIFYVVLVVFKRIYSHKISNTACCEIEIFCEGKSVKFPAIIDTGHSVGDLFSDSEIIFVSESRAKKLFAVTDPLFLDEKMRKRYRAIPCKTVDGTAVLDAFRCDKAIVLTENKNYECHLPIVAVSKHINSCDYSAIISPEILEADKEKTR
ncbi:MAG: sigma-E processing peptidase SpoIIGA [Clostridia bacterium]|nr:sigma-E processing peptidase SpoIIGA [Clostridia bacterium]